MQQQQQKSYILLICDNKISVIDRARFKYMGFFCSHYLKKTITEFKWLIGVQCSINWLGSRYH